MDDQNLGFSTGEADKPRLMEGNAATAAEQKPLTDRETAGFYRAMQDERDKRQALEKELENFKLTTKAPPTVSSDLKIIDTIYVNNLRVSRRFAEAEYGRELVSAVHDWAAARCNTDPAFNARMRESDDPYEAAKRTYDQEQALRTAHGSPSGLFPPRSLADAPGNGAVGKAHILVGDGNAYESIFK